MSELGPLCAAKRTSADHSGFMVRALKHANGCCFYLFPERLVQAVMRHAVGLAAKDAGGVLFHFHPFEAIRAVRRYRQVARSAAM